MRCGNCYLYAVRRYREAGGWIVLRRSVKARWVIHAQWAPSGIERGAEPIGLRAGLRRIVGPDRGYLCWQRGRCVWRARIHTLQVEEYLPPPWVDRLITNHWLFRTFPLHAVVFFGWVRRGSGEEGRTHSLIERTWSGGGEDG